MPSLRAGFQNLVALVTLLAISTTGLPAADGASRPNVLFLFADDQRADTIAALGNPEIRTPNLDRLVRRGVAFDRAYMQGGLHGATCVHSRAMLLSGRPLFRADEKLKRDPTWPAAFGSAGYTTFISGKWHNGADSIAASFQIARSIFAGGMTDPMKARLRNLADGKLGEPRLARKHACEVFADEAIRFLREHRGGPFFCCVPFDAPHDPHVVPDGFPIRYKPESMSLPPNFLPQHPWDNGEMLIRDERLLPWPRTPAQVRELNAEYYRYISYLDAQIGRILDALDASPHARNTIVVFAADSGVARGSHGLIGKQNLYEHSVRVPLIVAGPGIASGRRSDAMCYLFDVLPTIGKLCGVKGPATSEGVEFESSLRDPTKPARTQLMFGYRNVQRALRNDRWKLIRYPLVDKTQLFDLHADPFERDNLAGQPGQAARIASLLTLLEHEQQHFGDRAPLRVANPASGNWSPPAPRPEHRGARPADSPLTLQQKLLQEPVAQLAKAARDRGDAGRGAVLFFQPFLTCAKCHDGDSGAPLGPEIAKAGKDGTAEHLIESVLLPSVKIKSGYETVVVNTSAGQTYSGLVVDEKNGALSLVDPAASGKRIVVPIADIESRTTSRQSLMPDGLVNLLSDRQQFLDLAKYLIEIAERGPARARELRPAQMAPVIPEYEKEIDHAGMIRSLDGNALRRGAEIYARVCRNCHGTPEAPGSMPTSLRFAAGKFKNGSDPYSLYQTLTRGYGMMAPQTWMVPRQKYDVIHYLRETYLKTHNPSQYAKATQAYCDGLPKGTSFGPPASTVEPWALMDYGPSLMNTYEIGGPGPNFAYKGLACRLDPGAGGVSRGRRWALFDHDTMRFAAAWSGSGFIDWMGIQFNGQHQVHPKLAGDVQVANPVGPGWANPETGRFDDPRLTGRDGRRYGPLPRAWAKYTGSYQFGDQTIVSYTVGGTGVVESFAAESDPSRPGTTIYSRTLEIGATSRALIARIAPATVAVAIVGDQRVALSQVDGYTLMTIPASANLTRVKVLMAKGDPAALDRFAKTSAAPQALKPLTAGGPKRWPEVLKSAVTVGKNDGPFGVDTFALPEKNPWNAQLRLTGFDFFADGDRAAICSWDGDVWLVTGFSAPAGGLTWQRIASGLFQPLGLKIRDGNIFVCCRDQIVWLHDLNGDGEIDFYECFNDDHQVTEHFHEFAMGLQTDAAGNFYYAKSGRHALPALVPHHGTLLKVTRDGLSTEILATGFRAANGVCLNPDGTFFVTDQEGHWTPKNRINLVEKGGFYGNMWGYTDVTDPSDSAMRQPVCWITNEFDRSPAELLRVTSDQWGPLKGSLLNISYGHGMIYVVPHETVNGQMQGGMCALPLPPFPTGIMRGRFHPHDGHLYTCGMFAWAGNRTQPGGFYRVRYTGKPADLPVGLKAKSGGVELTFTDPLEAANAADVKNYEIKVWGLLRSQNYGSKHVDERMLPVTKASPLGDGRTVHLEIADLAPTRGMEIRYRLKGRDGRAIVGVIHNTIHAIAGRAKPDKPTSHTVRTLEGWTIRVDDRLLTGPDEPLGTRALRSLEGKLRDISLVVPQNKLKKLQAVAIVLDLTHGKLGAMQYHPSAGWLRANGYSADLAKCVHIPQAAELQTKLTVSEQPWVILHELAHAYHDQVLGFDEPRIKEAYMKFRKSGRGEKTLLFDGRRVRHYALTDHKEFFAEMTEAFFGVNDFFPFNRAELKEHEPEILELLAHIWESPELKPRP